MAPRFLDRLAQKRRGSRVHPTISNDAERPAKAPRGNSAPTIPIAVSMEKMSSSTLLLPPSSESVPIQRKRRLISTINSAVKRVVTGICRLATRDEDIPIVYSVRSEPTTQMLTTEEQQMEYHTLRLDELFQRMLDLDPAHYQADSPLSADLFYEMRLLERLLYKTGKVQEPRDNEDCVTEVEVEAKPDDRDPEHAEFQKGDPSSTATVSVEPECTETIEQSDITESTVDSSTAENTLSLLPVHDGEEPVPVLAPELASPDERLDPLCKVISAYNQLPCGAESRYSLISLYALFNQSDDASIADTSGEEQGASQSQLLEEPHKTDFAASIGKQSCSSCSIVSAGGTHRHSERIAQLIALFEGSTVLTLNAPASVDPAEHSEEA